MSPEKKRRPSHAGRALSCIQRPAAHECPMPITQKSAPGFTDSGAFFRLFAVAAALMAGIPAGGGPGAARLTASVRVQHGAPRLLVNGKPTAPLIFFFNLQAMPAVKQSERYLREQVALAKDAGVHLYSIPLTWPRKADGEPDTEWADRQVDLILDLDPEAKVILRLFPGMSWTWHEWRDVPEGDQALFADGSRAPLSAGSPLFWEPTDRAMARMIRHYEGARYCDRIVGYHLGGPDSENFAVQYREKGPDLSPANQARFRRWLAAKYPSDGAISEAWGRAVALASAEVPRPEPGRFPMHSVGWKAPVEAFYDPVRQRDWIDYSDYSADLVARRIRDWARVIKRETGGRKLSVFFYGYTFELPGSFSGHDALQKVLACPDVDVLVSPYAYGDRGAGGAGAFMAPVDSVAAHGKLWLNEDDTRTHAMRREDLPSWWGTQDAFTRDGRETVGVLGRNVASVLAHRAGTWWMDLGALGAFNHAESWRMLQARAPLFTATRGQYRPDCALILDERSRLLVRDDWDVNYWTLLRLRDEMARIGATVGLYTLDDFAAGRTPRCKMTLFANAFGLEGTRAAAVRRRLQRDGGMAVWLFAPGCVRQGGFTVRGACEVTGMEVVEAPGRMRSRGEGALAGLTWGPDYEVRPRLAVADAAALTLGRYAEGRVSCAMRRDGSLHMVFIGDMGASSEMLRRLAGMAGAHIWTQDGSIVQTDGATLAVHAARDGDLTVTLPPGLSAEPLDGIALRAAGPRVTAALRQGDTLWLRLVRRGR